MRYSGRVILVCYVLKVDTFLVLSTEEYEWATVMLKKKSSFDRELWSSLRQRRFIKCFKVY